ncbi:MULTISPECIES: hypothetical protein [Acetobacteraceae]|uniref:hypothetical protein n=1 Tax=Acetobacteraceae TaxID=433 RepID=UPI001C4FF03E|nr:MULTISPECIES: hypothetical protein [Acetobacteraceae]
MTGGQETLSHPLNPSRKSAQPSDSKSSGHAQNPQPFPGRKRQQWRMSGIEKKSEKPGNVKEKHDQVLIMDFETNT